MSQDPPEEKISGNGLGKRLIQKKTLTKEEVDQYAPLLSEFINHCKERNISREMAGRIVFKAYDETVERERMRRVTFARKVFQKIAAREFEEYEHRCARFAELNAQMVLNDKETFDLINAARAAGRFSSYPSTSHLTFVCPKHPPAFRLCTDGMLFGEAVRFFEYWKRAHPTAEPTEESRLLCLADMEQMLLPADDFAKDDFVNVVMESFDLWKQGQ